MSAGFTPGPWGAQDLKQKHPRFGIITAKNIIVARAWVEPDAHLIAAAPDLYEALNDLLAKERRRYDDNLTAEGFYQTEFADALAALAKARGEQS